MAINEITITDERSKVVDFCVPYFDANQGFLITKGGPAEGVQSIADMKDLQFGFQAATTGGDYINDKIQPDKQPREFTHARRGDPGARQRADRRLPDGRGDRLRDRQGARRRRRHDRASS